MSEWRKTTLGEISTKISYGYTESASSEPIGPKFLRITDIAKDRLDWENVPYCPITKENLDKYLLKTGDIVIARTGATTGSTYTIKSSDPNDVVFASYLIRYKIDTSLASPFFIDFILRSRVWVGFVEGIKGGSAQPGANANQFASFELNLPPLPEQHAIASVLSSLDDKIDLLHRQNKTLEAMADTLFKQWFVEEAQISWPEVSLSALVETANTGLDAIRRAPIVEEDTGVKCLRIQDISQNKKFSDWGNSKVNDKDFERARLVKDDIIMARTCSPGIIYFVHADMNAVFNNGLARIRANKEETHSLFLYYLFRTRDFIGHIYGISGGTSVQLNMKLGDLLSYKVRFPPKQDQDGYLAIFKLLEQKIFSNTSQIRSLEKLRNTLLPKLMSGEVRVQK